MLTLDAAEAKKLEAAAKSKSLKPSTFARQALRAALGLQNALTSK